MAASVDRKHLARLSRPQRLDNFMEGVGGAAVATSPAALAYFTTETGVFTLVLMIVLTGWLLTRRAADFDKSLTPTSAASAA